MTIETIIAWAIGLFVASKTEEGKLLRTTGQDGLRYLQRELREEPNKFDPQTGKPV